MVAVSGVFPQIYNTTDSVRVIATQLICVAAIFMPFDAYCNAAYFTLRSGGQTFVTFLFDSCFMWVCCVPVAFILSRFTAVAIIPLYFLCTATNLIKCVVGYFMIKKGTWIQNLAKSS